MLLEDQDRSRWDRAAIEEGTAQVEAALRRGPVGPYQLQAAIAALHAEASSLAETDWAQICGLYRALAQRSPSPVVDLNRAVAVSELRGPEVGLVLVEQLGGHPGMAAYGRAQDLTTNHAERRFFVRRQAEARHDG